LLSTEILGSVDQVDKGCLCLGPLAGLETAVGVDPELVWAEVLKHFSDPVLDLLLAGNTWGMDIVDTWTDVTRISLVNEDLQ